MFFNVFSVLVTDLLNSLWKTIINLIRPLIVWIVGLFTHYCIDADFGRLPAPPPPRPITTTDQPRQRDSPMALTTGEKWTNWSFLQLLGLIMLVVSDRFRDVPLYQFTK